LSSKAPLPTVARDGTTAVHDLSADAAAGDDPILRSFPFLGVAAGGGGRGDPVRGS